MQTRQVRRGFAQLLAGQARGESWLPAPAPASSLNKAEIPLASVGVTEDSFPSPAGLYLPQVDQEASTAVVSSCGSPEGMAPSG